MKKQTMNKFSSAVLAIAMSSLLASCGGGGETVATIDPTQLKGRWTTAAGVTPGITAVVIPEVSGTAQAWLLAQDASRLVKLVVRTDSSANGKFYALSQANATGQTVAGQMTASLTATPKSLSLTGVNAGSLSLIQIEALNTPAVLADVAGTWSATSGGNAQTTRWSVTTAGGMTGNSTTGCTYVGSFAAIASTAAYSVQLNESCPDGVNTTFSGIATLNTPKSGMTVVVTSADETKGTAVFFAK